MDADIVYTRCVSTFGSYVVYVTSDGRHVAADRSKQRLKYILLGRDSDTLL